MGKTKKTQYRYLSVPVLSNGLRVTVIVMNPTAQQINGYIIYRNVKGSIRLACHIMRVERKRRNTQSPAMTQHRGRAVPISNTATMMVCDGKQSISWVRDKDKG